MKWEGESMACTKTLLFLAAAFGILGLIFGVPTSPGPGDALVFGFGVGALLLGSVFAISFRPWAEPKPCVTSLDLSRRQGGDRDLSLAA